MTEAIAQKKLTDRNSGCTGAVDNDAAVFLFLSGELHGIDDTGKNNNGRSVLIVMEDRNVHGLLQTAFDFKTARRADILQIDSAEGGLQALNGLYDLVHILRFQADREGIHPAEFLEQNGLALHNRHRSLWADVAKSQNRGSIADNRNGILLQGIGIGFLRILMDDLAGLCNARCIGKRQILSGLHLTLRLG